MPNHAAFEPELVLAHDRWLRALARSLVADADSAEDLAQQSWVKALEHRPQGDSLHGWLRTTLERLASSLRRADSRRERRERHAARHGQFPSAGELHEREALRRSVVDAVLALEEPYRTTIALRFFEGLPPRVIARRMEVPVETVRTRIKRALERLRARLDSEHGDRGAWCTALLAIAAPTPPLATFAGALLVTTKTKVGAALLAAIALSLVLWSLGSGSGAAASTAGAPNAGAAAVSAARPAASAPSRMPLESAPSSVSVAPSTGSLLVRVRWHDLTPAADVGLRVWVSGLDDPSAFDLEARTDAAGEVRIADLAPGRYGVMLDRVQRTTTTVGPGKQSEVALQTGGTASRPSFAKRLRGIVVAWDDTPVAGAEVLLSPVAMERSRALVAARTSADGTFELRDVEPDTWIEARAPGYAPSLRRGDLFPLAVGLRTKDDSPVVTMRLVLPARGGRVAGVVLDPKGNPVEGAIVLVGLDKGLSPEIHTRDGTAAAVPSLRRLRSDAEGRFACDGVAAGRCDVVVRARGFGVWKGDVEVPTGAEGVLRVELAPGVTLRGTARDTDGAVLEQLTIRVGAMGTFEGAQTKTQKDGTFELRGLAAGAIEANASGGNHFETSQKLVARPGDVLTWNPILEPGRKLEGRVIDEQGAPVAARIRVQSAVAPDLFYSETATDEVGRFVIAKWRDVPTQVDVVVARGGSLPSARVDDARPGKELVITVRAADLPSAFVTGTLLGPDGQTGDEAAVRATSAEYQRGTDTAVADPKTGAFRLGPLPAGEWRLWLGTRGCATRLLTVSGLAAHEVRELGTLTLARPGTLEVKAKRADGKPLAWSWVTWSLADERADSAGYVLVIQDGTGECATLAPGKYVAQVHGEGIADARVPFAIAAGERTRLDVALVPAPGTRLVIVPPQDDASRELRLVVRAASDTPVFDQKLMRAHRSVPFATTLGLSAGKHRFEARTDGGATGTLEIQIGAEAREQPVRLELVR